MSARWQRGLLLKVVYPALMLASALSKKSKEGLQAKVIALNNRMVRDEGIKVSKLLIMLPHCIQIDKCKIRLTHNVNNCKKCGECSIRDLIGVAESRELELFVATGGSLARRILKDIRPDAVVAVACERDLSSGIADSYPLPVLGITNLRPHGPCFNTTVDMKLVEEAIDFLIARPATKAEASATS